MGFLDSLIGRTKLPKSNEDRIFAMSTAVLALQTACGLSPTGKVGVIFKALPPGRFQQLVTDTLAMIRLQDQAAPEDALQAREVKDDLGFDWLVVEGADFQAALAAIHSLAQGLLDEGLGDRLLAAAFPFSEGEAAVYWIYSYKDGTFYPFCPSGNRRRDNAEELRLAALAKEELPVEPAMEKWFPIWGAPV